MPRANKSSIMKFLGEVSELYKAGEITSEEKGQLARLAGMALKDNRYEQVLLKRIDELGLYQLSAFQN